MTLFFSQKFDSDINTVKPLMNGASEFAQKYPRILEGKRRITLLLDETSEYASPKEDGGEIISECFSSVYNSTINNQFTLSFIEACDNIIKKG